jgi:hypothetical protein
MEKRSMAAKSTQLKADGSNVVKRELTPQERATREILKNLGRGPDRPRSFAADEVQQHRCGIELPVLRAEVGEAVHAAMNGAVEKLFGSLLTKMYSTFREEVASLVEYTREAVGNRRVFCPVCSHDDCQHFHATEDYTVEDLAEYLGVEKATIYSWIYRQQITGPVSENPHLWDPHVVASFKHDKRLVFTNPVYDRADHLHLLKTREVELAARKAATHAKRSAHAVRLNADRKKKAGRRPSAKKSTVGGTSRKR